jgi:hypothetical protein
MPHLQKSLTLSLISNHRQYAKAKIAVALKDFQQSGDDVRVDAAVNGLRPTGIEYDARTLRVVAEANGAVNVAVTQLPK